MNHDHSFSTLGVSTDTEMDDPAEMSSLAIMAELRYYGADLPQGVSNDRDKLERLVISARQDTNSKNLVGSLTTAQSRKQLEQEHKNQSDLNFEDLLVKLLDDDDYVTAIDLSGNRIGAVDVGRLADALMDNKRVHQVWLRGCDIGNAGAKAIALCLEQNMSIVDLFLANNNIGDEGIRAISNALETSNQCLVSLEFDNNDISADGLEAFTRALSANSSLLVASFEDNPRLIGDNFKGVSFVQEMLAEKRNSLGLFDFVVDVNADDVSASNLDHMSECSSYMPSTDTNVGATSQAFEQLVNLNEAEVASLNKSSFRFSVYNRANKFRSLIKVRKITPKILRRRMNTQSVIRPTPSWSKMNRRLETSASITTWKSNSLDRSGVSQNRRFGYQAVPLATRRNTWRRHPPRRHITESFPNDALLLSRAITAESIMHPETQRDFNTLIKQLWRRIETMKLANKLAAVHYRARHLWCWFIPISSTILVVVLLTLVCVLELAGTFPVDIGNRGYFRLGLAIACVLTSVVAFALHFLQIEFGWSSRALVHHSTEVELDQVAFRLDKLCKYEGQGLTSSNHSTRVRIDAIRELYRIDVYLLSMQRCTPPVPVGLHDAFYLLASRLKRICIDNPHSVRARVRNDESLVSTGDSNPLPLEVYVDALDILGQEIEKDFLFPLFIPKSLDVVTRTIDALFVRREEGREDDDSESSSEDSSTDEELGRAKPAHGSNIDDAEEGKRLPSDWCESIDRNTGDRYYYNQKTGTSSWERPTNQLKSPEAEEFIEGVNFIEQNVKVVLATSSSTPVDTPATEVELVVLSTAGVHSAEHLQCSEDVQLSIENEVDLPVTHNTSSVVTPTADIEFDGESFVEVRSAEQLKSPEAHELTESLR